jgi:BlaI family penicillinase repressor
VAGTSFRELSRRERQVMDIVYAEGEATVNEVQDRLPDPPSYSAVRSTMRILESKGHLVHAQEGPRYVYSPAVPREAARKAALRHLVSTFFDGSPELAAVALLRMEDTELSAPELERLAERIEEAKREGR